MKLEKRRFSLKNQLRSRLYYSPRLRICAHCDSRVLSQDCVTMSADYQSDAVENSVCLNVAFADGDSNTTFKPNQVDNRRSL